MSEFNLETYVKQRLDAFTSSPAKRKEWERRETAKESAEKKKSEKDEADRARFKQVSNVLTDGQLREETVNSMFGELETSGSTSRFRGLIVGNNTSIRMLESSGVLEEEARFALDYYFRFFDTDGQGDWRLPYALTGYLASLQDGKTTEA